MSPQCPENKEILIGAGIITALDGPITFTNLASLRIHEADACQAAFDKGYRAGFRMGLIAAGLLALAVALFRMIVL
jgi:hypothetical protein